MSQPERYEMLVLGSGAGGKLLAWQMARSGHRSAVVERQLIGGACQPRIPLEWSVSLANDVQKATDGSISEIDQLLAAKEKEILTV